MKNVEDIYPLSPMQKGMLFHTVCAPNGGVYVTQLMGVVTGERSVAALESAWSQVIRNHAILRTSFVWEGMDEPVQVVHREAALPVEHHDWQNFDAHEQDTRLQQFLSQDRDRGCDLSQAPLMRLTVFDLGGQQYRFVWTHHHLLLDGWSLPLILSELFAYATAALRGTGVILPSPRPYRDYIAWLLNQDESRAATFWKKTLESLTEPTRIDLGTTHSTRPHAARSHNEIREHLPAEISDRLQTLGRQNALTVNTIVQGAWAILLSRYSANESVVFGSTVSGRPADLPGVETMVGLFINTLPVRFHVNPEAPLLPWLKAVQTEQLRQREYEYCSLTAIQGWSGVPRSLPLFESILIFENYPAGASIGEASPDLPLRDIKVIETTNYPLALIVAPGKGIELKLNYDRARFPEEQIQRMLRHLRTLLEGIAAHPESRLSELPMLSPAERQQLLVSWNDTATPFADTGCAHQLFEAQAAQTPRAPAVVFDSPSDCTILSYAELNRQANQLAHRLRRLGVGPESITAIALERSPQMIVAILAVLKAGGAYLPLALEHPADRLQFVLQDAKPQVLLTQVPLRARFNDFSGCLLCLDSEVASLAMESPDNLDHTATAGNLAYVIYTSGSTGRPKGVLLEHRGLCNLAAAQGKLFQVAPETRVLQFAAPSFDASVSEIFVTLLNGGTLCLARREHLMPGPDLLALLHRQRIHLVTLPPSVLATLPEHALPHLRTLVAAGEACSPELVQRWAGGRSFLNAYGPTEATVCATVGECLPDGSRPLIGRPVANARIYLVDASGKPVPVGVAGEVWIGGAGVARGYLNRPELNSERFAADPFCPHGVCPYGRIYKTGDRARYRPDGTLDYLGRLDNQVKIRGFRIEPGEIEAVLRQHPAVRDAAVIDRTYGPAGNHLVAYVAAWQGAEKSVADLRRHLSQKLPDYMIPAAFVWLDALPLTAHGKLDRNALPTASVLREHAPAVSSPVRSNLEKALTGIWCEILALKDIGLDENFFELGGHSLLATQLISRLRDTFGVNVPFAALFDHPTIAGMARAMLRNKGKRHLIEKTAEFLVRTAAMSEDELEALIVA